MISHNNPLPDADLQFELISALAQQVADNQDSDSVWAYANTVLAETIGHRLFTVLAYAGDSGLVRRVYSNQPVAYPVSGTKLMGVTPWGELVLKGGKPYIGKSAADIRWAFPDHELIASLGLESTLNLPLRSGGRVLGTLNLLHEADYYRPEQLQLGLVIATLLAPVMMRWLQDSTNQE